MSLNMNDPYLRAERQPPAIQALGVRLRKHYGVGPDAFGIKGNQVHYSGYHRSRAFLLKSDQGNGGDYSTRGSLNQGGNENNNCAWDFVPNVWGTDENTRAMIELTERAYFAARANDPRLADYYEFAGTLDGKRVITFRAQGGALLTPFDSSHLQHMHGSKYRSRADNDDTGLGDVLLGINAGEDEDDMGASLGPIEIQQNGITSITMPDPVQQGAANPRPAWINFCNATGDAEYRLRVYLSSGTANAWAPLKGDGWTAGERTFKGGERVSVELPAGTSALDIRRSTGGSVVSAYAGHLTCSIVQGSVIKK